MGLLRTDNVRKLTILWWIPFKYPKKRKISCGQDFADIATPDNRVLIFKREIFKSPDLHSRTKRSIGAGVTLKVKVTQKLVCVADRTRVRTKARGQVGSWYCGQIGVYCYVAGWPNLENPYSKTCPNWIFPVSRGNIPLFQLEFYERYMICSEVSITYGSCLLNSCLSIPLKNIHFSNVLINKHNAKILDFSFHLDVPTL